VTDQPNPAPQAAEQPAPAPDTSSFSFSDLLQREEVQALEAVKAAGQSMEGTTMPSADSTPAADTAPPAAAGTAEPAPEPTDSVQGDAQPPGQRPPEAVPYGRFAEVNRQRQEAAAAAQQAAQRIAYLEGQLAASRAPQPPGQQQPAQQQVDPIQVIDRQIADLDQKYEKSEINWAEYRRQQSALADHRTAMLVQRAVQQAAPRPQQPAQPAPPPSPRTSVALQQSVDQIKAAEPWVAKVPRDILEAPSIQSRVDQMAQATGRNADPRTEAGWLNRAIFTVLAAKEMGLDRAYGGGAPAPAQPPAQQPKGNGQTQQQTPTLPAQVKQPPAIGTMGVGAPAPIPGGYTAEQIDAMSFEDRMKLPREVLDHFAPEKAG